MQDVEEAVEAQEEHDVGSDVLDVSAPGNHVELGQNGHRLQPDGVSPQQPVEGEVAVEEEGEHQGSYVDGPVGEGVGLIVVALNVRGGTILWGRLKRMT